VAAIVSQTVVNQILACPFCRELFERAEAEQCPECDLPLSPLHELPPSLDALEEEAVDWERNRPEDELRAVYALGRGRGALLAVAVLSLLSFALAPWVEMTSPHTELRSGYSLARGPLGWLWGGAIAWFVSIALVLSRRTIRQMRGVRAILVLFSAMTLAEIVMLMALSPSGQRQVYFDYEWAWGLYASLALSAAGVLFAARFGGSMPEREPPAPAAAATPVGTLH
jgi:hypothetical protein